MPIPPPVEDGSTDPVVVLGQIDIPRLGLNRTMYEGIRLSTFDLGPGHWPGSAMPGELGNVVVAGHRVSRNQDFRDIDQLTSGDEVIFTTDAGRHVYRVVSTEIVNPDALWVVDQTYAKTATLFACHPPGSVAPTHRRPPRTGVKRRPRLSPPPAGSSWRSRCRRGDGGRWPSPAPPCSSSPSAPGRRRGPGSPAGMAFGLVWMAMGMAWMWQLTVPGYIATSLIFASWHGVAELVAPPGRWGVIGRPAAHSLVEALRFSFPFGGVPLASLGIAQAAGPLAGIARVGGVILITWVVFQVGFAARCADLRRGARRAPRRSRSAIGALVAAVAVLALAFVAPRGSGTGEFVDVAAVQGGGEQGTRAIDVPTRIVTDRHLEATRTIEPDESLDLVVWPENVIDTVDFATSEQLRLVAAEAARLGVPFAVGITEDVPGQPGRVTNAQVVVTPDGDVTSRYDKVRRVPFGEYVPLRGLLEALGAPVDQVPTNAIAGTGPAVIDLPDGTPPGGGDLVGGVLRRPGSGGREERRARPSSTRPTAPATPARSCRPSRSRRAGCGRSRPDAGWCRCRRPGSPSSSRPTAT